MKITEVLEPTRQDLLIRMSGTGRNISAEEIALVLAKEFQVNTTVEELARYVEPFNRALREINPTVTDRKDRVRKMWQKLAAEIAHPVRRNR